jgi:hypothetical protein
MALSLVNPTAPASGRPEPVARDGVLDWQGFVDAYYPKSRRHALDAITAYAAYRRSGATTSNGSAPIDAWEDEGGAV